MMTQWSLVCNLYSHFWRVSLGIWSEEWLVFLTSSLCWPDLSLFSFRVWNIWAGWDCSKTFQREHTSPPRSTTREACIKPGRSVSTYGRSFFKWGMFTCKNTLTENITSLHMLLVWVSSNHLCRCCPFCSYLEVSDEVRQYLKTPTFDNW